MLIISRYLCLLAALFASVATLPSDKTIVGAPVDQNPEDPKFKQLAQESFDKYRGTLVGGDINVKEVKVTKATTQLVAGVKTVLDFVVTATNGDIITCNSDVWEQEWLKKKEINVNCNVNKEQSRKKRQIPGGENEKDANDPKYKKLAQESFEKYQKTVPGDQINVKDIKVTKVTEQVVAGKITRINFTVVPSNGEEISCHSKIFEQVWINKKEIDVNCGNN